MSSDEKAVVPEEKEDEIIGTRLLEFEWLKNVKIIQTFIVNTTDEQATSRKKR